MRANVAAVVVVCVVVVVVVVVVGWKDEFWLVFWIVLSFFFLGCHAPHATDATLIVVVVNKNNNDKEQRRYQPRRGRPQRRLRLYSRRPRQKKKTSVFVNKVNQEKSSDGCRAIITGRTRKKETSAQPRSTTIETKEGKDRDEEETTIAIVEGI